MAKLYVGNISFDSTEDDIRELFAKHVTVRSVSLTIDPDTGRFRGMGFVEVADEDVRATIEALDSEVYKDRMLRVSLAPDHLPKTPG